MTNEIVKADSAPIVEWSQDDRDLIKKTVAAKTTDEEFKLFLYTATARGLNPLLNQIYCIKRKQKQGDQWVEKMTIQTGIEGYRLIANRTKRLKGIERGVRKDDAGNLYGWAKVYRDDWDYPAFEEVPFNEYKSDTRMWRDMPETMIKKVAEVAALRMAFPEDLSGLYTQEEMDQADKPANGPVPMQEIQQARTALIEQGHATRANIAPVQTNEVETQNYLNLLLKLQKDHNITSDMLNDAAGVTSIKDIKNNPEMLEQVYNDLDRWLKNGGVAA